MTEGADSQPRPLVEVLGRGRYRCRVCGHGWARVVIRLGDPLWRNRIEACAVCAGEEPAVTQAAPATDAPEPEPRAVDRSSLEVLLVRVGDIMRMRRCGRDEKLVLVALEIALHERDVTTVEAIARRLGCSAPQLSPMIDRLRRRGLVTVGEPR